MSTISYGATLAFAGDVPTGSPAIDYGRLELLPLLLACAQVSVPSAAVGGSIGAILTEPVP